jgi:hypothetical protein
MDVDEVWAAALDLLRELGPVDVRRSRFASKPAAWVNDHEVAHWDGPGSIDLHVTAQRWTDVRAAFDDDRAVVHEPGRRDWVVLRPASPADVDRLRALFEAAVAATG